MIKNKVSKIIFIGGNRFKEDGPFIGFAKECQKYKIDVILLVDKVRLHYPTKSMGTLKEALDKNKIPYEVISGITKKIILKHMIRNTMLFSVHCRWIIKKEILKLFPEMIFNYHNLSLPQQRGAAGHSWRIMQGIKDSELNIHKITADIDKGEIILKKSIKFPSSCSNLMDCYEYMNKHEQKLFASFLLIHKKNTIKQDEKKSFYWPRLDTMIHGLIDWNWCAKDIKYFCAAFDKPFKGASSFLNKNRVFFTDVEIVDKNINFHPFQSGLVYRIQKDFLYIATISGGLRAKIQSIKSSNDKEVKDFNIKLGDRFVTPLEHLYKAKISKSEY